MSPINSGKEFEKAWKESWDKTGCWFIRLQDAVKWGRGEGSSFMPNSPCDCVGFNSPMLYVLELKSTNGTSVSFNPKDPTQKPDNEKTNVMIKAGQVKSLLKFTEKLGVIAGFVINFRPRMLKTKSEPCETFFIFINDFVKFAIDSGKSGISREDCRAIGVEILGEIKKVHYKYSIEDFMHKATKKLLKDNPESKVLLIGRLQNFISSHEDV